MDQVKSTIRSQTETKGRRVALYARVSTAEQTTENQLQDLRRYATQRGWVVHEEYVDHGVSGATDSRPALNRFVAAARKREVDIVLCWRLDRVARSVKHLVNLLDELRAVGVAFVSFSEAIDFTTPMGKAMFAIIGAMAELERNLIIERVNAGIRRARSEGKRLGRPPAEISVEQVTALRAQGLSVREIARRLEISKTKVADVLKSVESGSVSGKGDSEGPTAVPVSP